MSRFAHPGESSRPSANRQFREKCSLVRGRNFSTPGKILLVDEDEKLLEILRIAFEEQGNSTIAVNRGADGLKQGMEAGDVKLVITDLRLPDMKGLELLRLVRARRPRLPIIVMTGDGTAETAIESIKCGAFDYITKPFEVEALLQIANHAMQRARITPPLIQSKQDELEKTVMVGNSRSMQLLYKEIGRVAGTAVPVLIRGETGTGKELVAGAIHQHSQRSSGPLIEVNCAAIPETLLEAELFGHERGAFTGAYNRRTGWFERADGATLFLDEIGDISLNIQCKLLRVLQEKCIVRLGGREKVRIDVRILAATHRDLERAVRDNLFREDLFHRLNGVTIEVPSLRQRREDIPALVSHLLELYSLEFHLETPSIDSEAVSFLQSQDWPGNVRQLQNVVRKGLLNAGNLGLSVEDFSPALQGGEPQLTGDPDLRGYIKRLILRIGPQAQPEQLHRVATEALERELLGQVLALAGGNQSQAAGWLGLSRPTLREKMNQFCIL